MAPVGEPTEYDSSRTGNTSGFGGARSSAWPIPAPIGELVIPLDSSVCTGMQTDLSIIGTQPNAQVSSAEGADSSRAVSDGTGHSASLNYSVWQGWYATIGVSVFEGDVPRASGRLGDWTVTLSNRGPLDSEASRRVIAAVELTLVRTERTYSYEVTSSTGTERWSGEILDGEGTLVVNGGVEFGTLTFDLAGCTLFDWTAKTSYTNPKGPKTHGGSVPANDLPSGAITLKPGSKVVVATKGASPDFEAGFECDAWLDENGNTVYLNIGHTVWYKIPLTGSPVASLPGASDSSPPSASTRPRGRGRYRCRTGASRTWSSIRSG